MNVNKDLLIVRARVKYLTVFSTIVFAVLLDSYFVWLLMDEYRVWKLIVVIILSLWLLSSIRLLFSGSRSLVLLVKDSLLYTSIIKARKMEKLLPKIMSATHFDNQFDLSGIEKIWKYTVYLNGDVFTENIKISENGTKKILFNLGDDELKLKNKDLDQIKHFIVSHNHSILIGEAEE